MVIELDMGMCANNDADPLIFTCSGFGLYQMVIEPDMGMCANNDADP